MSIKNIINENANAALFVSSVRLPYVWNFPNMSGISVVKLTSGNNFYKCSFVQKFDSS